MNDARNLHLRLQEYSDCFAETDPSLELEEISGKGLEGDKTRDMTETALKYLSLTILSGIENEARNIFFTRNGDLNGAAYLAGDRETRLPMPPTGMVKEIMGILRCITGLEPDNGSSRLIWGIRNDQLEIAVGATRSGDTETLSLTLPQKRQR